MIDPLTQLLQTIEKASLDRDNKLAESITSIIRQQTISGQLSTLQQQKEILAHLFDKSSSYTNLVMLGGYAALFAIWQLMKSQLSYGKETLIAILLISSIILFAGFEVIKMISQAFFLRRLNMIIESNASQNERLQWWSIAFQDNSVKQTKIWIYFLIPTVFTGFGAGLILLWVFLQSI